jgi:hypothetical protein
MRTLETSWTLLTRGFILDRVNFFQSKDHVKLIGHFAQSSPCQFLGKRFIFESYCASTFRCFAVEPNVTPNGMYLIHRRCVNFLLKASSRIVTSVTLSSHQ